MKKGLISFIILTYRNFDGIYDTLDSLFTQDYPEIELIISDDCSPNAEEELPKIVSYIDAHKSANIVNVIVHKNEVNVGTVKNINGALKLASGEYIKNIGADDMLYDEHTLTNYKEFLEQSGCLICCAKVEGVTPDGKVHNNLAAVEDDYDTLRSYTPLEFQNRLFRRNCIPAPAVFMKAELFQKYGFYHENTRLIEDYPYWLYLCREGVKFAFSDQRLIRYRLSGVSSGGFYSKMFMDDMLVIYDQYIFPYDKRFGIFQGFYNFLKREGLGAYIAIAEWKGYSFGQKLAKGIRYALFFAYIKWSNFRHAS